MDANVDRWLGQFQQPDGRPSKAAAKIEKRSGGAYKLTVIDVTGTFADMMMPGAGAAPAAKPGWRMLGAIAEASEGNYFVKATGPAKTLELWKASFDTFLVSLRPAST